MDEEGKVFHTHTQAQANKNKKKILKGVYKTTVNHNIVWEIVLIFSQLSCILFFFFFSANYMCTHTHQHHRSINHNTNHNVRITRQALSRSLYCEFVCENSTYMLQMPSTTALKHVTTYE